MMLTENSKVEGFKFTVEYSEGLAQVSKTYRFYNMPTQKLEPIMKEILKDWKKALKNRLRNNFIITIDALEHDTLANLTFLRFVIADNRAGEIQLRHLIADNRGYKENQAIEHPVEKINSLYNTMVKTVYTSINAIEMVKSE